MQCQCGTCFPQHLQSCKEYDTTKNIDKGAALECNANKMKGNFTNTKAMGGGSGYEDSRGFLRTGDGAREHCGLVPKK